MKTRVVSLTFCALALGLAGTGCSTPQYRYVPAQHQGPGRQKTLALYPDPVGPNSGMVRINSLGMVTLKPKGDSKEFPALHLRMSVSNSSKKNWTIDASEQTVSFPNQVSTKPVYVNSDSASLPQIEVRPGELRSLDLYFPLPPSVSGAQDLPEFDFHWTVSVGSNVVAEMTPFERQPLPDYPPAVYPYGPYLSYGYGGWWYGPRPYWW